MPILWGHRWCLDINSVLFLNCSEVPRESWKINWNIWGSKWNWLDGSPWYSGDTLYLPGLFLCFLTFDIIVAISAFLCLIRGNYWWRGIRIKSILSKVFQAPQNYLWNIGLLILLCLLPIQIKLLCCSIRVWKHAPTLYNGVIVSYGSLVYLSITLLTGQICHIMPKCLFTVIAFILISVGMFLQGPS